MIFYNMGEMCMVGLWLFVYCDIKDVFIEKFVVVVCVYVFGNLFDLLVLMGVIVDGI